MSRAHSVQNIINAKFEALEFTGHWLAAVGKPEPSGSWFVYGPPKNGKTTFAMMLAKYLASFRRVAYNSIEEGVSRSIQLAMKRVKMIEAGGRVVLLDKEGIEELTARLDKHKSPEVIVIDSVQFAELTFAEYKMLKERYPNKLFIYVSHVDGRVPEGRVAKRIWRDANIAFRVEGFKAFPIGRYGGGTPVVVSEERAREYWG